MIHAETRSLNFGKLMILVGGFLVSPLGMLIFYPQDAPYAMAFVGPAAVSIILGLLANLLGNQKQHEALSIQKEKHSVLVLLMWIYGFFMAAIPFVLGGQLSFVQALFESVSGWTTTGLSVMDVRVVPKIFLFYRSFMQYCGGLGFVLIMAMFFQGKQAMSLFSAEGHPDQLLPNLKKTARTIVSMYAIYLVIGSVAYWMGGMSLFDAINHAMCALSTGGFSTQYDSIGAYHSLYIEAVTIFLMVIGTTNFAVLLLLSQGKFKQFITVSEVRFLFVLLLFSVPLVAGSLVSGMYMGVGDSFRVALFNIVSGLSTTGFSTMSYAEWPAFSIGIMIILMVIGGGIGSTAGGMKMSRVYLLCRILKEHLRRKFFTSRRVSSPYFYRAQGKTYIDHALELDVIGFVAFYFIIFMIGSLCITLTENCTLAQAMFEFASALGTVGLSIGLTGPTTNAFTLIVEMLGMMLGRLEIFIVIVGIYSMFKMIRKRIFSM